MNRWWVTGTGILPPDGTRVGVTVAGPFMTAAAQQVAYEALTRLIADDRGTVWVDGARLVEVSRVRKPRGDLPVYHVRRLVVGPADAETWDAEPRRLVRPREMSTAEWLVLS